MSKAIANWHDKNKYGFPKSVEQIKGIDSFNTSIFYRKVFNKRGKPKRHVEVMR